LAELFFLWFQGLREWVSLTWGFAMPILDKQAVVMIQKLLKLEEQLFKIILKKTVTWYYATYAFSKSPKKHAVRNLSFNFHQFLLFFSVRLQRSLTHNALAPFSRNFAFGDQKTKTKIIDLFMI
jgi:hypothetical protein